MVILKEEIEIWMDTELQNSTEQDQPGQLAIINGRLRMEEPTGNGAWPIIAPGKGVQLRHEGELIGKPTVLESAEGVDIEVVHKPSISEFDLVVSQDQMQVVLKTRFSAGTKYRIEDTEYVRELTVNADAVGRIPPKPIDSSLVVQELDALGIKAPIFYDRIHAACTSLESQEVVICEGREMKPSVDGKVEIVCELTRRLEAQNDDARVNYLDRGKFNAVSAGDVLAHWYPPIPGEPGQDVYGNIIEVTPPASSRLRVGKGVKLIRNGTTAVAEVTGLPSYDYGVLQVNPQLVIDRDVSLVTGNVEFKGDVTILGSVTESLTVKAGGSVEVLDSVYHARVLSGSDVIIHKKLIGGTVIAGAQQPGLAKAEKLLQRAIRGLESLHMICSQLKKQPRLSVSDLKLRGDGYLVKLVLETKFPEITKTLAEVHELFSERGLQFCDEECLEFVATVRAQVQRFLGPAPLEMKTLEELSQAITDLQDLTNKLDDLLDSPADITVYYGQNAKMEATGDITVSGPLLYDCDVVAGGSITVSGECRSGSYIAGSAICAHAVGSKGLGVISLIVGENGTIGADTFYPGVKLRIGSVQTVIEQECHNQKFHVQEGKLVSSAFRRGGVRC